MTKGKHRDQPDQERGDDPLPGPRCAEDVDNGACEYCGRPTEPAEEGVCWRCRLEPREGEPLDLEPVSKVRR